MNIVFGHLALIIAAIFAGAALYVTVAEQPARLTLDEGPMLSEWKPSYRRGFAMQAPLALASFLFGLAAWFDKEEAGFLAGALLMLANWPWTLIAIMPVNNKLKAIDPAAPDPSTRQLIRKWGRLHAVRSALGVAAVLTFFFTSIAAQQ
jgi:uncharacterized membrane protein